MNCSLIENYERYLADTGSEVAAAIFALAAVQSSRGSYERDIMTPPQVAKRLGVDPVTVIGWIRSGQLKAANVGKGVLRPRFKIQQSDLDTFLKSRQPERKFKKKRGINQPADEIEFFA